ncbi:hypothetical protein KUG08_00015 [Streptococcus equi subsp. equi]|uniref:hypothetical protein n=1 Tax=Streptococcus equi TaxID=1336 RepID=UPI001E5D3DD5|nr:hypothetical protein [Streptococcus equi]MCD3565940.1 hypothetical protein [Streptococcus equi subsp. equi]MCD3573491.1 hypothetical protein [Streptococcus equi subsp. equi]
MFSIEFLDGERLSADERGWKVKEMSSSGLEQNVVSESPKMRSGRLVYGLYHGIKTYQLVFTKIIKDTLDYSRLVDEVNYYFLRDEPYYLYRDFRKKADRVDLPKKRAKVFTKSIDHQKMGLKLNLQLSWNLMNYPTKKILRFSGSLGRQHIHGTIREGIALTLVIAQ